MAAGSVYAGRTTFGQSSVIGWGSWNAPQYRVAWGFQAAASAHLLSPNTAPDTPVNVSPAAGVTTNTTIPVLQSSAFSDPDTSDTHTASQWQVRYTTDTLYGAPVFDSGATTANLTTCRVPDSLLRPGRTYFWHVGHQDNRSSWSLYSDETSFSVASSGWIQIGASGPARTAPASGFDTSRSVGVIFGGADLTHTPTQDTWEWNGGLASWTRVLTTGPSNRMQGAMEYDAARGQMLLQGGWYPDFNRGDTWTYDGVAWSSRGAGGPSNRAHQAIAYDSLRQKIILYGGIFTTDTWQWNGTAWALLTSTGPTARLAARMAYDPGRDRIVLFGGQTGYPGAMLNDTWEWNGTTWTLRATNGPSTRTTHMMVYDPVRQRVILFGGAQVFGGGSAQELGDTWEWDGTTWTQIAVSGPRPRYHAAMFYDTRRQSIILHGGTAGSGDLTMWEVMGDTWELRLGPAPNRAPNRPTNLSPAAGATEVTLTPTLVSSVFSDPDTPDTHTASQWQIATANDFSTSPPLVWDSGRTTGNLTSVAVPAGVLRASMLYYWRVRHQDIASSWSLWSAPTWFVTTGWIPRETNRDWRSVASSEDGTKLVACPWNDQLYTSSDSGVTWSAHDSNRNWYDVASSADGTKLVACVWSGGQIYTSSDSGATWTARDSNRSWYSVASSADGTKLVACVWASQIYTSSDSGATWTARESNRNWVPVASSADGAKLVAGVYGGQIYMSSDSGVTWTARESNRNWSSVSSSSDGTRLVACVQGGQIYTSSDSGVTWTARESNRNWSSVASSSDGTKLVACVAGGQIYMSSDSGVTWTATESSRNWNSVASAADGSKLVACVAGGLIYTFAAHQPQTPSNVSPTNGATSVSLTPTLTSSAFSDSVTTHTHAASQWQVRYTTDTTYSSPVFDSGLTTTSLTSCAIPAGKLQNNTGYFWRVRHQDNVGAWSQWSLPTSFTTAAAVPVEPAAPSNLTASPISTTRINLSWRDNSDNESGFRIERKTTVGGAWTTITTVAANVISYPNTGLSPATTYYYRVLAYNAFGNSPYSNEASATTTGSVPAPIMTAEPSFTAGTSNTVAWSTVAGAVGYYLEYDEDPAFLSPLNSGWITATWWRAAGLTDGFTYYYRVKCRNASLIQSGWSNVVSSTQDALPPDTAVSPLTPYKTSSSFDIGWSGSDDVSYVASVRLFFRRGPTGLFVLYPGTFTASPIRFTSATPDGDYYFYTRGKDAVGNEEAPPPTFDARTTVSTVIPDAPVMAAEPLFTSGTANQVGWSVASRATAYYLEWSTNNLFLPVAGNSGWITATTRLVTGLTDGQTYYYRVKSRNAASVESNWSNVVFSRQDASPPSKPDIPTDGGAYTSLTLVRFNWTAASDSVSGVATYDLQVGTTIGGRDVLDTSVGIVLTRTVTGANGQTLYARVRARDNVGNVGLWSGYSDGITIDAIAPTKPGTPTDAGVYTTSSAVRFTWTSASDVGTGVAFYELQVGTSPGGSNIFNGNVGNVLTRVVNGPEGQTLYARVRARDAAGWAGPWSGNSDGITIDTIRPRLLSATATDSRTVTVMFSETVVGADQPANYACSGLLIVSGAARVSGTQYRLTTSDQRYLTTYTLTAGPAIKDRAGNSIDVSRSSAVFTGAPGPPVAPSNLTITTVTANRIDLEWTDNANNEQGYKIERRHASSGAWTQIATTAANAKVYSDTGYRVPGTYYYRVRAYNGFANSPYSNPASSDFAPSDKMIIVAGGGNYVGNSIVSQTQALADRAFRTCMARGYTPDEVRYLSAFDDWLTHPNVDAQATTQTFWSAIDTWSSTTARLTLYLIDHGSRDEQTGDFFFRLNRTDYIRARDLDYRLDVLQNQTNCDLILIVDCCHAGGFVQQCPPPAGKRRIVISATTAANLAVYTPPAGSESFSFYFFSFAFMGNTLKDCFEWTRLAFAAIGNPAGQVPWMDDDGDGDSDKWDGSAGHLSREHVLGCDRGFGSNAPTILSVASTQTVTHIQRVQLWAELDKAAPAREVWAIVMPASATYFTQEPVTNLTRVNLAYNSSVNRWQATWTPGSKLIGQNTVTYFALGDDASGDGLVGMPRTSGLRVVGPVSVRLPWQQYR